jgi:hypothetical protein
MLLKSEKEIKKGIAEKLLTIIPDGMVNMIMRFKPFEFNDGYTVILNYTKPNGEISYYSEDDIFNNENIDNAKNYVVNLLLNFRRSTQGTWERCLVWVNKDGECDIDFVYW